MPKRKSRKSFRRPFKRRRRYSKRRYSSIARLPISGFPKSKLVRLRYVTQVTLDASAVSTAFNVFRLNSIYDPDYTGVGSQPTGTDQWFAAYDHATVLSAKTVARCLGPNTTANTVPCLWGIKIGGNATEIGASQTVEKIMMQPQAKTALTGSVNMGGRFKNTLSMKFSAKKFFHKKVVGSADYRHGAASNPNELAFLTLFATAVQGNNPDPIDFLVSIDYIVMFSEKKMITAS